MTLSLPEPDLLALAGTSRPALLCHLSDTMDAGTATLLANLFGEESVRMMGPAPAAQVAGALATPGASCVAGGLPPETADGAQTFLMLDHPLARARRLLRRLRNAAMPPPGGWPEGKRIADLLADPARRTLFENPACRLLAEDGSPAAALRTLAALPYGFADAPQATRDALRLAWRLPYTLDPAPPPALELPAGHELAELAEVARLCAADIALDAAARALLAERAGRWPVLAPQPPVRALHLPEPGLATPTPRLAGRQGFHRCDAEGRAWLAEPPPGGAPPRIHFRAPAPRASLVLHLAAIRPDYPVGELRLSLNGERLRAKIVPVLGGLFRAETSPTPLAAGVNSLAMVQPYAVPPCFDDPARDDARPLGLALVDFTLLP
jgi:hypothetical protein